MKLFPFNRLTRGKSYLSAEAEQAFVVELEPKAKPGELTTKAEVKLAFEQRVGQRMHKSPIYRLVQRHESGKRKPRPRHPKANPDQQEHFKATFSEQVRQILEQRASTDTRPILVMASDEGRFGRTGELSIVLVSFWLQA